MKHQDISEIWAGLLITGKVQAEYVLPEYLAPPYDLICSHLRDGKDIAHIIDKVGMMPVVAAKTAIETIGDAIDIQELLSQLLTSYRREKQIVALEHEVRRLKKGEDLDTVKIMTMIDKTAKLASQYVHLDEVSSDPTVWRKTFYPPIDEHCGDQEDLSMSGVPESGLVVIGGPPGCLVGSTMVGCNRGGKGFQISMLDLYQGMSGERNKNGRPWDLSIPTMLQSRYEDGTIRLNELDRIVSSGIKDVFKLTLENGYELVGTADHPVMTDRGWVGLGSLTSQDQVFTNVGRTHNGRTKPTYSSIEGLRYHPYAGRIGQRRYTVPLHRLIVEAAMNKLPLAEFIDRCRKGRNDPEDMYFIPRSHTVHHEDGDTHNNSIHNLTVMTIKQHHEHHAKDTYRNVQLQTGLVKVKSVIAVGMAETYDVYMKRDPHNFLANGIVVHNTGKTSLIAKIIAACAANDKVCLMYTLEMTTGQIARRILQVAMKPLTQEQKHNVIISDKIVSVDEVYTDAMRLCATEQVYAIFIDFSDMLVEGAEDEQSMAIVYRRCAMLAKENSTGAPVFLLAQLNRNYTGGVPKINLLRYSGMAEAVASLIFLIYNPNQIYATQIKDNSLPAIPGTGYIIIGKSRFGYREGTPGAIRVEFDGKMAWGVESEGWTSLNSV